MGSNKTFRTKVKLTKKRRQNKQKPYWCRTLGQGKSGVSYNTKRRHWRRTKLRI